MTIKKNGIGSCETKAVVAVTHRVQTKIKQHFLYVFAGINLYLLSRTVEREMNNHAISSPICRQSAYRSATTTPVI